MNEQFRTVDIPGVGVIDFPTSMSEADINAAANKLYSEGAGSQPQQEAEPDYLKELAQEQGPLDAAMIGAGRVVTEIGRGIKELVGKGTDLVGITENAGQIERDPLEEAAYAALKEESPIATSLGEALPYVAGGVATGGALGPAAGLVRGMAAQAATAGSLGALQPGTAEDRLKLGATNAALAATGEGIGRGIGRVLAPRKAPVSTGATDTAIAENAKAAGYKVLPTGRSADIVDSSIENSSLMGPAVKRINEYNQKLLDKQAAQALGGKGSRVTSDILTRRGIDVDKQLHTLLPKEAKVSIKVFRNLPDKEVIRVSTDFLRNSSNPAAKDAFLLLDDISKIVLNHPDYASSIGISGALISKRLIEMRELATKIMPTAPKEAAALLDSSSVLLRGIAKGSSKARGARLDKLNLQNNILALIKQKGVIGNNGHINAEALAAAANNLHPSILANTDLPFLQGARLLGTRQITDQTVGTGVGSLFGGALGGGALGATTAGIQAVTSDDTKRFSDVVTAMALGAAAGATGTAIAQKALPAQWFATWMSHIPSTFEKAGVREFTRGFMRTLMGDIPDDIIDSMSMEQINERIDISPKEMNQELNRYIKGRKMNTKQREMVRKMRKDIKQRLVNER